MDLLIFRSLRATEWCGNPDEMVQLPWRMFKRLSSSGDLWVRMRHPPFFCSLFNRYRTSAFVPRFLEFTLQPTQLGRSPHCRRWVRLLHLRAFVSRSPKYSKLNWTCVERESGCSSIPESLARLIAIMASASLMTGEAFPLVDVSGGAFLDQ